MPPRRPHLRSAFALRGTRRAALVALLLAQVGAARAAGPEPIVFGGDAHFPPYEFLDERGQPAGLDVELIRAIGRELGAPVVVRLLPWTQVRRELREGTIDVATMYRSTQRAREVDFATPHELIFHEMYVRRGAPPLRGLSELTGRKVLVERDAYADEMLSWLQLDAALVRVESEPAALLALTRGEGDVAVVTQASGRPFKARLEAVAQAVSPTGPPVLMAEYGFVTLRGRPELLERLNAGLAAVKASGEYDRLYARWVQPHEDGRLTRGIFLALGLAALATAAVVVWNGSLRRRVVSQTAALRREYEGRARAQEELAAAERSLRQAQKMEAVGRLAGGVAHDFNNIITVILSNAGFVREVLAQGDLPTEDVDELIAACERAAGLTRQLLAFSRATPEDAVALDLAALVAGMRPMLARLVGEHIEVEVRAPAHPVVVRADRSQVEQAVLNLSANARDAMPHGGRLALEVSTRTLGSGDPSALPGGEYAALVVADTGEGMDEATLARLAEPFFTTKELGRGTGFGLATVYAHAAKLGGRVSVESAPGAGSTFTLLLPLRSAAELASAPAPLPAAPRPLSTPRVLLVEDDAALRRTARIALERAGHAVEEAVDGEEALRVAGDPTRFGLVVTDVVMPRRSGPTLVAALRARAPGLRVLYVSGHVREGEELALDAPGTAFLQKPYSADALLHAVRELTAAVGEVSS